MKSTLSIFGIVLVLIGVVTLSYQGYTYTKHENVATIGDVQVTADTQKTVYFPPMLGGLALAAGVILLLVSRKN